MSYKEELILFGKEMELELKEHMTELMVSIERTERLKEQIRIKKARIANNKETIKELE